jgi:lysophospholipase L1-like esterase
MVTAAAISMPDAGQLLAGGLSNAAPSIDAQHNGVVGQVLADALHGGGDGPNVEMLINAISTGGDQAQAVADALASHAAGSVPNGDMGAFAGFTGPHDMPMDLFVMHVDAAPAQV